MKLKFDYNNMMADVIGERGIDAKGFAADAKAITAAYDDVMANLGKGWQEWTELPYIDPSDLDSMIARMNDIRSKASAFVVLGIGGSALGPISVVQALLNMRLNELPAAALKAAGLPKLYIEDNIDPERMNELLELIDLKTT